MSIRLALVALPLALLVATPASAKRKPCARLCKSDVKSCKGTCTSGTKRDKRLCKRGCKIGLPAICRSFTEPSCLPPSGPCGPAPLTCTFIALSFAGFVPNDASGLPANFPPPPAGATLCGRLSGTTGNVSVTLVFYTSATSTDDLAAYYGPAFTGAGYAFAESPVSADRASCDRGFKVTQDTTTVGGVYHYAQQGAFVVAAGGEVTPPPTKK